MKTRCPECGTAWERLPTVAAQMHGHQAHPYACTHCGSEWLLVYELSILPRDYERRLRLVDVVPILGWDREALVASLGQVQALDERAVELFADMLLLLPVDARRVRPRRSINRAAVQRVRTAARTRS